LQGWKSEGKKIAQVKWSSLCRTKEVEGLDIKEVQLFNEALLAKWKWIFATKNMDL